MVGGHHLLVDVGLDRNQPGAVALDGEFVEAEGRLGLLCEAAPHLEQRARLGAQPAVANLLQQRGHASGRDAGQEAQVAGVDAQHRDGGSAQPVRPLEQRAVAAVAEHHRRAGIHLPDAAAVARRRGEEPAGEALGHGGELLVDDAFESEGIEAVEELAELPGVVRHLRAGKSMIFIGRVSKFYVTLTSQNGARKPSGRPFRNETSTRRGCLRFRSEGRP